MISDDGEGCRVGVVSCPRPLKKVESIQISCSVEARCLHLTDGVLDNTVGCDEIGGRLQRGRAISYAHAQYEAANSNLQIIVMMKRCCHHQEIPIRERDRSESRSLKKKSTCNHLFCNSTLSCEAAPDINLYMTTSILKCLHCRGTKYLLVPS